MRRKYKFDSKYRYASEIQNVLKSNGMCPKCKILAEVSVWEM